MKKYFAAPTPVVTAVLVLVLLTISVFFRPEPTRSRGLGDVSNMDGLHLDGSFGTATPQFMIRNSGTSNSLEIRNSSATPVFVVDKDGNASYTSSGGGAVSGAVHITAPTAAATATPALIVNNLGAANNILSLRNDATPVFVVGNSGGLTGQDANLGGNVVIAPPTAIATATPAFLVNNTGAGNNIVSIRANATPVFVVGNNGAVTASGGQTINNWAIISAPTAVITSTPAAVIDNAGPYNNLLEVRKAATPVFTVGNGGTVTGYVFSAAVSGRKCVQGTQQVTGTGTIAHGLSTPVAVQLSLAEDVTGDGARLSYTNSSAVVTAKVWTAAATPAAASSPHTVDYTICGTP